MRTIRRVWLAAGIIALLIAFTLEIIGAIWLYFLLRVDY